MPRNVTQFDLLISCPSDVKEELEIIKETVADFNRMYGAANDTSIVTKSIGLQTLTLNLEGNHRIY